MAWLIMNDQIDYSATWYPTHIVSKDKKLIKLFIGASQTVLPGYIGLWIRDEDYDKIRHDKAYILIHDPEATDDYIVNIEWDKIKDNESESERKHYHIWKNAEFKGEKK
jgi:hypothetical protein